MTCTPTGVLVLCSPVDMALDGVEPELDWSAMVVTGIVPAA